MIKSYFKIAWRSLISHKSFSIINIGGLSIGIAAFLIISMYGYHQLSYDRYHAKKDRIVRITNMMLTPEKDNLNIALSPFLLATTLKKEYPEVETAVRFEPIGALMKIGDKSFKEELVYKTDADVFNVFSYKFAEGNPLRALTDLHSIVLTKSLAKKYFGKGSALGKTITCNDQLYHVTAVLEDLPENSDMKINALLPSYFSKHTSWLEDDFMVYTFVLFRRNIDYKGLEINLAKISKQHIQPELTKAGAVGYSLRFDFEPLTDVHFSKGKLGDTCRINDIERACQPN
jgi:putative ABC transport system permease protein